MATSADGSDLDIRLRLRDAAKFNRDAQRSGKSVRGLGKDAEGAGKRAKIAGVAFGGMRSGMLRVGVAARSAGLAVGVAAGIVGFKAVKAAVDLGEQTNKTRVIFKSSAQDILNWSKTTDTAFGLSQRQALTSASQFGGLFNEMQFGEKKAAKMSKTMVGLAADLASFGNTTTQEALDALQSGFAGEVEPLRKYNVFLTESKIATEAASLGLKEHNGELTEAQKTQARYSLILKSTTAAQGDFGRTSGSLANQWRTMSGQLDNLSTSVGGIFIPILTKAAKFLTGRLIPVLQSTAKEVAHIFGRKDIDLGDKFKLTGQAIQRNIGPFANDLQKAVQSAQVQRKLDAGMAWLAPRMGEAFAKAAPKAISAFWNAFSASGTTGQALTVGVLATKLGITGPLIAGVGGLVAKGVTKGWGKFFRKTKLPIPGMGGSTAGVIQITAASVVVSGAVGPDLPGPKKEKGLFGKAFGAVKGAATAAGGFALAKGGSALNTAKGFAPMGLRALGIAGTAFAVEKTGNDLLTRLLGIDGGMQNPMHRSVPSVVTDLIRRLNSGDHHTTMSARPPRDDKPSVIENHIKVVLPNGRVIAETVSRESANKRARK